MNALVPGSFDPMTLGHINIIERASVMFDRIYVAVMNNDSTRYDKSLSSKEHYLFTPEQRLEIVRRSVAHVKNAYPIIYGGRLIDCCDEYDISAVIRGVRNTEDFEYELKHAKWNREHNPRAQALLMPAEEKFGGISSTMIKKVLAEGGDLSLLCECLSTDALTYIKSIIKSRKEV